MRNHIIGIDHIENQAIREEIGERLRARHEHGLNYRRVSKKNSTNSVALRASGSQSFPKWTLI
jgi:hypothetical protein